MISLLHSAPGDCLAPLPHQGNFLIQIREIGHFQDYRYTKELGPKYRNEQCCQKEEMSEQEKSTKN